MQILASGIVVKGVANTDMSSCCFPSIGVLGNGRWISGFRLGPAKSSRSQGALVCWSDDQGKTWSKPIEPAKPIAFKGVPGTWRAAMLTPLGGARVLATLCWEDHSDPFVPLFNEETEGVVDLKLFTVVSEDGGEHWSTPLPVDADRYREKCTPITGPTLVMPDGTWAAQFEVNNHYYDRSPWQHASVLVFSGDQGKTWNSAVDTHSDPQRRIYCWDQRVGVLRDGSMLDTFWTLDRQTAQYLNIHSTSSTDNGRTWAKVWDTGVPGQPARPVSLPDGRIFMAYVDRTAQPVIKARISSDGGHSFPAATELVIHQPKLRKQTVDKGTMQDAWSEMAAFSLGLPDAVGLPDGQVLVVFYNGPRQDLTSIHWARIRT